MKSPLTSHFYSSKQNHKTLKHGESPKFHEVLYAKVIMTKQLTRPWNQLTWEVEKSMNIKNAAKIDSSKIEVKELNNSDIPEIEALLKTVWSTAFEYPQDWREKRILTQKQILQEIQRGYHYFGIRIDGKLAGLYKAIITEKGLFGEHQAVDPKYRGQGLATAMYLQFMDFCKQNNCGKVYINVLAKQVASVKIMEKLGFQKSGPEYEQSKGMIVQIYEKKV